MTREPVAVTAMTAEELLRTLGDLIRAHRQRAGLTQRALGDRAGIVGKYVSEIERGTRDVPISTLLVIVERGLQLHLDISFRAHTRGVAQVPMYMLDIAHVVAELAPDRRAKVLGLIRGVVELAR